MSGDPDPALHGTNGQPAEHAPGHDPLHPHAHEHDHPRPYVHVHNRHTHMHGVVDPLILTTKRGIWAIKWSFVVLFVTAVLQIGVVLLSQSVALLADTIHNLGDAVTAIPLWIAFTLARRRPNRRFTYGYGRVEDLAGVVIVLIILFSAGVAVYEAVDRLLNPQPIGYLWAVALAALIGFLGNEGVALFRIQVGREIGSAALVADGYHARADGLTSLAVLLGAIGVWLGLPLADPLIGLLIAVAILRIVWGSGKAVFTRLLDGVDPEVVDEIHVATRFTPGVREVTQVRVRWLGHRLRAEVNVAVDPGLTLEQAHIIAMDVRHELLHHLRYLSDAMVHVDPLSTSGEEYHRVEEHAHGGPAAHSHP